MFLPVIFFVKLWGLKNLFKTQNWDNYCAIYFVLLKHKWRFNLPYKSFQIEFRRDV